MSEETYIFKDGYTYIRVEPTEVAREIESFKIIIQLADAKISEMKMSLCNYQEDSHELDDAMERINDIEMAVDDMRVQLTRLNQLPREAR